MSRHQQNGFTIVELLIVVVVIAILAAITIAAYNGIQNRANDAAVKSDLATVAQKVKLYQVDNGVFPNGLQLPTAVGSFTASKGSYATHTTTDHNLIYCMSTDKLTFAVVAYSKSGNKFVATESSGVASYTNAWTDQVVACQGALGANYAANSRGYAGDDLVTGPWRAWTGS
jgi:prepilin-type N-terminal cleavage/methylation domain-containing protein